MTACPCGGNRLWPGGEVPSEYGRPSCVVKTRPCAAWRLSAVCAPGRCAYAAPDSLMRQAIAVDWHTRPVPLFELDKLGVNLPGFFLQRESAWVGAMPTGHP